LLRFARNDGRIRLRDLAAHTRVFAGKVLPCEIRGRRECRARNAPAASRVIKNKTHERSHHGHTGNTRHSPRNGFNGFLRALPGEPRSFATVSVLRKAACNSASLFNSNIFKILKDKLDRRNIAAHPSSVVVVQSQADDVVTDLVNNVVLALT
jgi:hypothetical protein